MWGAYARETGDGKDAKSVCRAADGGRRRDASISSRSGETGRIRKRAHAILLSAAGQSINEVAKTFEVTRNTVRDWLARWERDSVCGLADAERSGKPPILTEEEQTLAVDLLKKEPRSTKTVLHQIYATTGKTISAITLRRIARRAGCVGSGCGGRRKTAVIRRSSRRPRKNGRLAGPASRGGNRLAVL